MIMEDLYDMKLHETINATDWMTVMRVPGGWIYDALSADNGTFVPFSKEFKPKTEPKQPAQTKPDSFKRFFALYPATRKGGTDASAWKKAKAMNLKAADFDLMVINLEKRIKLTPEWYAQWATGICKYLEERTWLVPIEKEKEAVPDWAKMPKDDAKLEGWAKQHGYPAPGKGQSYNEYRRTLETKVRHERT